MTAESVDRNGQTYEDAVVHNDTLIRYCARVPLQELLSTERDITVRMDDLQLNLAIVRDAIADRMPGGDVA